MDEQQIQEIAEKAFRANFEDVEVFRIDVEPKFDHDGDPIVDVNIVCANNYDKLRGRGLLRVQSEIVSKTWRDVEDNLGFPIVQFFEKETFEQPEQSTA